jgi:hypothetical protein
MGAKHIKLDIPIFPGRKAQASACVVKVSELHILAPFICSNFHEFPFNIFMILLGRTH